MQNVDFFEWQFSNEVSTSTLKPDIVRSEFNKWVQCPVTEAISQRTRASLSLGRPSAEVQILVHIRISAMSTLLKI